MTVTRLAADLRNLGEPNRKLISSERLSGLNVFNLADSRIEFHLSKDSFLN